MAKSHSPADEAPETGNPGDVARRAAATDRLLKALIAHMALRDPNLIRELGTVFAIAAREDNYIAQIGPEVWSEIGRELQVIRRFVTTEGPDEHFHS